MINISMLNFREWLESIDPTNYLNTFSNSHQKASWDDEVSGGTYNSFHDKIRLNPNNSNVIGHEAIHRANAAQQKPIMENIMKNLKEGKITYEMILPCYQFLKSKGYLNGDGRAMSATREHSIGPIITAFSRNIFPVKPSDFEARYPNKTFDPYTPIAAVVYYLFDEASAWALDQVGDIDEKALQSLYPLVKQVLGDIAYQVPGYMELLDKFHQDQGIQTYNLGYRVNKIPSSTISRTF